MVKVSVHWVDFAVETALKMADALISALTTELIETHPVHFLYVALLLNTQ